MTLYTVFYKMTKRQKWQKAFSMKDKAAAERSARQYAFGYGWVEWEVREAHT